MFELAIVIFSLVKLGVYDIAWWKDAGDFFILQYWQVSDSWPFEARTSLIFILSLPIYDTDL